MSDDLFEHDLERMFGRTPEAPDADDFHRTVMRRLEHRLRLRRWTLTGAGVVGAVIAVSQTLGQIPHLLQAGRAMSGRAEGLYAAAAPSAHAMVDATGLQSGMLWVAVGLAAVLISGAAGALRDT